MSLIGCPRYPCSCRPMYIEYFFVLAAIEFVFNTFLCVLWSSFCRPFFPRPFLTPSSQLLESTDMRVTIRRVCQQLGPPCRFG